MTRQEVADYLGLTPQSVDRLVRKGKLTSRIHNPEVNRTTFDRAEIERYRAIREGLETN